MLHRPAHALPGSQHISPPAAQRVPTTVPTPWSGVRPFASQFVYLIHIQIFVSLHQFSVLSSLSDFDPPCCRVPTFKFCTALVSLSEEKNGKENENKVFFLVFLFFFSCPSSYYVCQTHTVRAGRQRAVRFSPSSTMSQVGSVTPCMNIYYGAADSVAGACCHSCRESCFLTSHLGALCLSLLIGF